MGTAQKGVLFFVEILDPPEATHCTGAPEHRSTGALEHRSTGAPSFSFGVVLLKEQKRSTPAEPSSFGMPWLAMTCHGMPWHALAYQGMPWTPHVVLFCYVVEVCFCISLSSFSFGVLYIVS